MVDEEKSFFFSNKGTFTNQSFKPFFEDHIAPEAQIKTDEWTGYLPLKKNYQNIQQIPSGKKGENFQLMHRSIMMFKT